MSAGASDVCMQRSSDALSRRTPDAVHAPCLFKPQMQVPGSPARLVAPPAVATLPQQSPVLGRDGQVIPAVCCWRCRLPGRHGTQGSRHAC